MRVLVRNGCLVCGCAVLCLREFSCCAIQCKKHHVLLALQLFHLDSEPESVICSVLSGYWLWVIGHYINAAVQDAAVREVAMQEAASVREAAVQDAAAVREVAMQEAAAVREAAMQEAAAVREAAVQEAAVQEAAVHETAVHETAVQAAVQRQQCSSVPPTHLLVAAAVLFSALQQQLYLELQLHHLGVQLVPLTCLCLCAQLLRLCLVHGSFKLVHGSFLCNLAKQGGETAETLKQRDSTQTRGTQTARQAPRQQST